MNNETNIYVVNILGENWDLNKAIIGGAHTNLTKYGPTDASGEICTRFNRRWDELDGNDRAKSVLHGFIKTTMELSKLLKQEITLSASLKQNCEIAQQKIIQLQTLANENEAKFQIAETRGIAAEALCLELQGKVEQLTHFQEKANLLELALALSQDKVTTLATENLRREQERRMLEEQISELNNRIKVLQNDHKAEKKQLNIDYKQNVTKEIQELKFLFRAAISGGNSDSEASQNY